MKYEGVRTLLCRCWTQPKCIGVKASYTWWLRTARRVAADTITMVKPLAPVGKQIRCAVAPKNLCVARDTHKLHYVALVQRRQENYASTCRTSAHDGTCALSCDVTLLERYVGLSARLSWRCLIIQVHKIYSKLQVKQCTMTLSTIMLKTSSKYSSK